MYNFNDASDFARETGISQALSAVTNTGAIYAAAQSGALQMDAEVITTERYDASGALIVPTAGGVWICGMAVGSRPVEVSE